MPCEDEYKYAVAGVPFREKWNLTIARDREREERLFRDVVRSDDFVLAHLRSSEGTARVDLESFAKGRQIIEITPRTNNVFDWLSVIERASRIMTDSCFANLIEQLEISGPKVFLRRSLMQFTPVLRGDWTFLTPRAP